MVNIPSAKTEAKARGVMNDLGRVRVLLVEDAPFLRYAFGRLLRMHGFDEVRRRTTVAKLWTRSSSFARVWSLRT